MVVGSSISLTMQLTYFIVILATSYYWASVGGMRSVPTALGQSAMTESARNPVRLSVAPRFRQTYHQRALELSGKEPAVKTGVFPEDFSYVLTVGLGTPPTNLTLIMDTGSEFTWTQCKPCIPCYRQEDPIFNPANSSTYNRVPCDSGTCDTLGQSKADCNLHCQFAVQYMDGSRTHGDYAQDALWINGERLVESFPVGCGHSNTGIFDKSDGIIGFNTGNLAFPAQAHIHSFAYCLSNPFNTSAASPANSGSGYLTFPAPATDDAAGNCTYLLDENVKSYVVYLQSVTVNDKKLAFDSGIVVDSGTVITRLPNDFFYGFRDEVVRALNVKPTAIHGDFDTCFRAADVAPNGLLMQLPTVTLKFDGLVFTVPNEGLLWGPTDEFGNGSVYCLAILPSNDRDTAILGNFQQQGRQFTFDIAKQQLCIAIDHTSC